ESAAAKTGAARLADHGRQLKDLRLAFHGAGAGDDTQVSPANLQATRLHQSRLWLHLRADELVGRAEGNNPVHAVALFQDAKSTAAVGTARRDHDPLVAGDDALAQAEIADTLDHTINVPLRGAGFHDHNHRFLLKCEPSVSSVISV